MQTATEHQQQDHVDGIVKHLMQENETYRKNFEQLKKEYVDLTTFVNEQTQRWRGQLEAKTTDFEKLRSRFDQDSADLEQMKLKLMEEFEMRSRLEKDLQECEKYKSMYQKVARELQQFKSETEEQKQNLAKQLADAKQEYEITVSEMKQELDVLRFQPKSPSTTATEMQLVQKRNDDLQVQCKLLLQELDELRHEKSTLMASKEEVIMSHSQQFSSLLAKSRGMEDDLDRYKRKVFYNQFLNHFLVPTFGRGTRAINKRSRKDARANYQVGKGVGKEQC